MRVESNGVGVYCLPDNACCKADDEKRSPLELDLCPLGYDVCDGDCDQYSEDEIDKLQNVLKLIFASGNTLSFATNKMTAKEALYELQDTTPRINWNGMNLQSAELYDADGCKIDEK